MVTASVDVLGLRLATPLLSVKQKVGAKAMKSVTLTVGVKATKS